MTGRQADALMRSIADVQSRLKELHFFPYTVDGVEGPRTRSAITAYQISIGLPASGVLTTATEARLFPSPPGLSKLGIVLALLSISRDLKKGNLMGFVGKIAALFSARYTKAITAFLGVIIGFIVGPAFSWAAEKGFGSCAMVATENVCTISFGSYHWTSTQVTMAITGMITAWLATHAVKSAPANKA